MKNTHLSILAVGLAAIALLGAGCNPPAEYSYDNSKETPEQPTQVATKPSQSTMTNVTPPEDLLTERTETGSSSKAGPIAIMKTNQGDIKIQLFEEATPKTVENFVTLAEQGFYNGTLFHRVIPDFMIQGGDPNTREMKDDWSTHGTGGPGYKFADEFNEHKNVRGMISMANAGPGTNGSQFFLITAEATPWLDGKHAVFGEIIEGMDTVDKIEATQTNGNDHPLEDMEILEVTIER